jgi:hypothetical protein
MPRRLALAAPLLALSCAGAPPPPPHVDLHVADPGPQPPPQPPPSARWVAGGGATLIGPAVGDATLVLLGGRRALVGKDGAVQPEKSPSPEPLLELAEVPTAAGPKLVARGAHGVYRIDDPLGAPVPLAHADGELSRLGAAPGVVAVWLEGSDLPRFLDVATGAPHPLAGLPAPPMRAVAFKSPTEGAAVFEAAGLAVTGDGGATWRLAGGAGDALRMSGLRRRGDAIRAYGYAEGPDAPVDLAAARLGVLEPPAALPATAAAILRWVQTTGRDPLEAAASGGIDLGARGALVASHGLVARVDPRTGGILELVEFAHGKWMSACAAAKSGEAAWIACPLSEDQGGRDLFDPFGVLRVSLGDPILVDKPAVIRNGDVELRASPSGGAMLLGACGAETEGDACARQSDGKWISIRSDVELGERGAGPLADGRIAFLRGTSDGEDEPDPHGPADAPASHRLHVALLDASGKEAALAPITLPAGQEFSRVESPIEEEADHSLHFVIEAGSALLSVGQAPGRDEPASVQPIPGGMAARLHAGRGVAVTEQQILASLDAGSTWAEVPSPAAARSLGREGGRVDQPEAIAVSEVGARVGSALRIGWGPADPIEEPAPPGGPALAPALPADRAPASVLTCKSEGEAKSTAPLLGSAQLRGLLGGKPVAKGTRREVSSWSSGHAGMLDTLALLEEQGPDKRGSTPSGWTLRWLDPTEIGAKVRSWSGPVFGAPSGKPAEGAASPTWGASLRFAMASGGRALFAIRSGSRFLLARAKGTAVEMVEAPADLLPSGEAVFGADKGDPIAWMHESDVVVWLAGEPPRAIGQVATHAVRLLGQPTAAGVPVLLGSNGWSILKTIPIPALDPRAGSKPPPAPPASLDGWAAAPDVRRLAPSLPVCGPRAAGARFTMQRTSLPAEIDGAAESGMLVLLDVRMGAEICAEKVSALLMPDRRPGGPAPAPAAGKPGKKKPAAATGPVSFVRADLANKHAEGGDRGLPPAPVRRLGCSFAPGRVDRP